MTRCMLVPDMIIYASDGESYFHLENIDSTYVYGTWYRDKELKSVKLGTWTKDRIENFLSFKECFTVINNNPNPIYIDLMEALDV